MSLFDTILRWLGVKNTTAAAKQQRPTRPRRRRRGIGRVQLVPFRRQQHKQQVKQLAHVPQGAESESPEIPSRFARFGGYGGYLDLSKNGNEQRLIQFDLPHMQTPEDLAQWLEIPNGRLAWLVHRFDDGGRAAHVSQAHYHYRWLKKRGPGYRLIEAPKAKLKSVQQKILREILDHIPLHDAAHGFAAGRSILTNARPHIGQRVVLKFDLENFYANVTFSRVVAIFRSVGYPREAAIWLGRLTTSLLPAGITTPEGDQSAIVPFLARHLPQGAPTSPALANLSCYALDIRLTGMARAFGATYTRYADDLTFSGDQHLVDSLNVFIPLITKIIRAERFMVNSVKRKVMRNNQQQRVTGVVVNERANIPRAEFDRLKAILTNCARQGPSTQNLKQHADFAAYLQGRISHVRSIHPQRGEKLQELDTRIDWNR